MAEHRYLLGRIAVEHKLITSEQLEKCIRIQQSSKNPPRLGQVLLDLGHVNRHQLRFLEERQQKMLEETDVFLNRPTGEILFGKLVQHLGYCTPDQVSECLREAAVREVDGQEIRLGEILVQKGYLSPYQLNAVLAEQHKRILYCETCSKHFNVLGFQEGYRVRCLNCRSVLTSAPDPNAVSVAEEYFFDVARAENVAFISRIAVKHGFVSKAIMDQALALQETSQRDKPLLDVLVGLGKITSEQARTIRSLKDVTKARETQLLTERLRKLRFGQVAVQEGLVSQEMVDRALTSQLETRSQGKELRLGAAMVAQFFLTEAQVVELLRRQAKAIARCASCDQQYNVSVLRSAAGACPRCSKPLEVLDSPERIEVADDLTGAAAQGEGKLAVIELEKAPETPAGLTSTKRIFREFYQREKALQQQKRAAEGAAGPVDLPSGPQLVPLEVARQRIQATNAHPRRVPAWAIAAGGGVLALVAVVAAIGFGSGNGSTEAAPSAGAANGRPAGSSAALVEGARLAVLGVIPAGDVERIAVIRPDLQAFLLVVGPGKVFWAIDRAGRSWQKIQFLTKEPVLAADLAVRIEGVYSLAPPPSVALPGPGEQGCFFIESWERVKSSDLPSDPEARIQGRD